VAAGLERDRIDLTRSCSAGTLHERVIHVSGASACDDRAPLREGVQVPQLSLHTPVGDLSVSEEDGCIVAIDWGWGRDQTETGVLLRAREQLHAYFDGELLHFDLPLNPAGTPYRRRVWQALCDIPPGQTRTYGEIALVAGGGPRAVGSANSRNPIPIVIPCHRVVAGNGIGGYSGGDGLATKQFLLALEARAVERLAPDLPERSPVHAPSAQTTLNLAPPPPKTG
jgi:methylated-DNA-[protein]-cysteine S-methyltransferase